ncbi:MAG: MoxR family ATPase [Pseudomonadota bacterium]
MADDKKTRWHVYEGTGTPHDNVDELPPRPPWRPGVSQEELAGLPAVTDMPSPDQVERGQSFKAEAALIDVVNAALYLRRPLLLTGKPGIGKSSLAYAVAHELKLGAVLKWPVNSRTVLRDGLYSYDAIGRLQEAQLNPGVVPDISRYLTLGPLGTALLPWPRPRVLLIDELDKADIDLPNDLLEALEEGAFTIPELARDPKESYQIRCHAGEQRREVNRGNVRVAAFPMIVITSNGEREFPPAFLRRCLRYTLPEPGKTVLEDIVEAHLGEKGKSTAAPLIEAFLTRRETETLATDQLLNAVHMVMKTGEDFDRERLIETVLQSLESSDF